MPNKLISYLKKPSIYTIFGFLFALTVGGGIWIYYLLNDSVNEGQVADNVARAETAIRDQDYPLAFKYYQNALELDPSNNYYIIRQADIAFMNHDYRVAMNLYKTAKLSEVAEVKYYEALQAISESNLTEALLRIDTAIPAVDTERPLTTEDLTKLQKEIEKIESITNEPQKQASIGKLLIEEYAFDLAKTVLVNLTTGEPDYRDGHYLLGINYLMQGQNEDAKDSLGDALKIDPRYKPALELSEQLE